ncbi:MAG: EI24 domain-containing protein [Rhodobacteraceae bacterium]|nr:EI24 domain-containing protein [Paracoccaceae bacterium]
MILGDFLKALGQLHDRRFLKVLVLGILLALALLGGIYAITVGMIGWFVPASFTLPWIGEIAWVQDLLSWGSLALMLVLSIFLMVPVASAFTGIFLDDVADAVEARHYPGLPAPLRQPFGEALADSLKFLGVILIANLVALVVYFLSGPFAPLVFWAVNGFLLGREYFQMAAMRRLGRGGAMALRKRHSGQIFAAGLLMAAPLSVPVVNLLIPVLGAATFTHLFHRLNGDPFREAK